MIVTGRRLDDLRRVAGSLDFVDGVVAENGALVHFPDGGLTTALARSQRHSSPGCRRKPLPSRQASA